MEQQQWSEWIEWKGGECPIPWAKAGEWQCRTVEGGEGCSQEWCDEFAKRYEAGRYNEEGCWPIVAYRVRLTAQQPATAESDCEPDIGDGVDENARMVERDAAGMAGYEKPEPVAQTVQQVTPNGAPGLLVVAPMERLGATRWGAE